MHNNGQFLSLTTGQNEAAKPGWRWQFGAHVLFYVLVTILLTLLLPLSIHAVLLRSLLLVLLCLHFCWLNLRPVEPLRLATLPLPVRNTPLLPDGTKPAVQADNMHLWYRWHDV
jgi:hypothetical protein